MGEDWRNRWTRDRDFVSHAADMRVRPKISTCATQQTLMLEDREPASSNPIQSWPCADALDISLLWSRLHLRGAISMMETITLSVPLTPSSWLSILHKRRCGVGFGFPSARSSRTRRTEAPMSTVAMSRPPSRLGHIRRAGTSGDPQFCCRCGGGG